MDKYLPLFNYLRSIKNNNISLLFSEIEKIINAELPMSAYKYREWWSNGENSGHSQAFSWRDCGWQVDHGLRMKKNSRYLKYENIKRIF